MRVQPQRNHEVITLCKGQKRPADMICNAVQVMRMAIGEEPAEY